MTYRFQLSIVDDSGTVIESDFTTITDARIDEYGGCEVVDHAVAKMMRNWRRFSRAEYEGELVG